MSIYANLTSEIASQRAATGHYLRLWQEKRQAAVTEGEKQQAQQQISELLSYLALLESPQAFSSWLRRPFRAWCSSPYHG